MTSLLALLLLGSYSTDWVSFTMIDGFPVTNSNNICGITMGSPTQIVGIDPDCDSIFVYDTSGAVLNSVAISSGCPGAYGVAIGEIGGTGYWFLNDTNSTVVTYLWRFDGGWSFQNNPAGGFGRGMGTDYNLDYIYQASLEMGNCIHRFQPDGSNLTTYTIAEVQGDISGVAVFELNGHDALLISGKDDSDFHVYEFLTGVIHYRGSGQVPDQDATVSLDLAYLPATDSFFWSYRKQGQQYIMQFDAEITQSLEAGTWAGIKNSFS